MSVVVTILLPSGQLSTVDNGSPSGASIRIYLHGGGCETEIDWAATSPRAGWRGVHPSFASAGYPRGPMPYLLDDLARKLSHPGASQLDRSLAIALARIKVSGDLSHALGALPDDSAEVGLELSLLVATFYASRCMLEWGSTDLTKALGPDLEPDRRTDLALGMIAGAWDADVAKTWLEDDRRYFADELVPWSGWDYQHIASGDWAVVPKPTRIIWDDGRFREAARRAGGGAGEDLVDHFLAWLHGRGAAPVYGYGNDGPLYITFRDYRDELAPLASVTTAGDVGIHYHAVGRRERLELHRRLLACLPVRHDAADDLFLLPGTVPFAALQSSLKRRSLFEVIDWAADQLPWP